MSDNDGSGILWFLAGLQGGTWAEKGRDYLNSQKEQVRSAYEAGRQAYREATTEEGEPTPQM